KIADFGLSRATRLVGTPSYAAPEQVAGEDAGPPADVYALGAVLYEMLTGKPPFTGDEVNEVLRAVRTRSPAAPRQLRYAIPRDLATICLKCLEKQPAHRDDGAKDLADDLGLFLAGDAIRARPPARGLRSLLRRPLLALAVAAAVVAAAAVVGLGLWH